MRWLDLQEADAARVFDLLKETYSEPQFPMGGTWNERLIETELNAGYGLALESEGELHALALFRRQPAGIEISVLATRKSVRRQGIMSELLQRIAGQLNSGSQLWLEVHENNIAARNLYEKLGFTVVGRRPKYYRDGGAAVLYSLAG